MAVQTRAEAGLTPRSRPEKWRVLRYSVASIQSSPLPSRSAVAGKVHTLGCGRKTAPGFYVGCSPRGQDVAAGRWPVIGKEELAPQDLTLEPLLRRPSHFFPYSP